jgi:thioester reductase-like protein
MIHSENSSTAGSPEIKNIFLTGATGFVGAYLLTNLLNHTSARVICLVLGGSLPEAKQTIAANLERHQLSVCWSRVRIVLGDLSQHLFGMNNADYDNLKQEIDLIIHAGADLSPFSEYEKLKEVNVDGLGRVLKLANGERRIPVTHLSSYGVFNEASYREEQVVFEEPIRRTEPIFRNGYVKSKWMAECLCEQAHAAGAPVKILRLPYILGAASTGTCNPNGYIELILKAMLLTSLAPQLDYSLTCLPVDICADLVVRISLHSQANPCIFHLTPFAPIPWAEICEAASNYVHDLEHLPPLEWYQHIKKCALTQRELFSVVALLAQDPSLMHFQSNIYRLRFDTTHLSPYLGEAPAFPQGRSNYLRRYMESVAKV